jgi:beta-lactamase regulating signal transducer with metallopeptidase domain
MSLLLQYLVKLSISLSIVWLFYQLVLRKLTFYNSNRWYLIGYTLLSFLIPFVNIAPVFENKHIEGNGFVHFIPSVQEYTNALEQASECPAPLWSTGYDKWDWIAFALLTGTGIFLLQFIFRCISFFRMRRKAKLISEDGVKLYQVNDHIIPFSFGNAVFINSELHTEAELKEIISHEFVHVKQKHTIDIIWSEWLCIINWYNPFAWLLKRSIRQNLEFIADNKVLENGVNKKQYQYLLLKVIGNNQYSIAPKFNFSSLKKRIAMMNKLKTARLHLVKFLFILPLLAVVLISFRKQIENTWNDDTRQDKKTIDSLPPTAWNPKPTESEKDFLRRHPKVKDISWGYILSVENTGAAARSMGKAGDAIMNIHFTNGKWDMYNLGSPSDVERFKKNYGENPPSPPPYPGDEPNTRGNYISIIDNDGECTVVVKDKNKNEIARLPLTKWNDNEAYYEKLYGEIPPPPPPIPPAPPVPPGAPTSPVPPTPVVDGEGQPSIEFDELTPPASVSAIGSSVAEFEITNTKAVMFLKDGTKEEYDLSNPEHKKKFESRYGRVIAIGNGPAVGLAPVAATTSPIASALHATTVSAPTPIASLATHTSIIAPAALSTGVIAIDDNGHSITGNEDAIVTITTKTTLQQLEEFKKQMKAKGVELKIEDTKFEKGVLKHITGTMICKDSKSSFSATDFSKLILAMIKDGEHVYLKVNIVEREVI